MGISLLHRKEYLILTTIDIIEERGIQGLRRQKAVPLLRRRQQKH